ncbi:hypothetical protein OC844_007848 [Tilletia horrida]|nr:hypothetical protein OC844_007848 [Tilletia horrida]
MSTEEKIYQRMRVVCDDIDYAFVEAELPSTVEMDQMPQAISEEKVGEMLDDTQHPLNVRRFRASSNTTPSRPSFLPEAIYSHYLWGPFLAKLRNQGFPLSIGVYEKVVVGARTRPGAPRRSRLSKRLKKGFAEAHSPKPKNVSPDGMLLQPDDPKSAVLVWEGKMENGDVRGLARQAQTALDLGPADRDMILVLACGANVFVFRASNQDRKIEAFPNFAVSSVRDGTRLAAWICKLWKEIAQQGPQGAGPVAMDAMDLS